MTPIKNPILPGFHPDPSICRVGDDYYLATSSFEYFPGVPLYHSRDLSQWTLIGYALKRPSQLDLSGFGSSRGVYAPTLRYHNGTFYMINTLYGPPPRNYLVTATDPAGDWSDPIWLDDAPGIDPSLFFDADGRAWFTANRTPPQGEQFRAHREIWLQEFDLKTLQLTGTVHVLWDGALHGAVHAEAPHLFYRNGWYYLLIAEGGTFHDHAVTIARSQNITGPYIGNPRNPILTHRHLGQAYPIVATGHADLVETPAGDWWMVALACRPYGGYYYNLGRETFIAPVVWEEDWPIVSPGLGHIAWEYESHLPAAPVIPARYSDHFDSSTLALEWNMLRTPHTPFWSLTERPGWLRLKLQAASIKESETPSFIGRRQQHIDFMAQVRLNFTPHSAHECAGLVLRQRDSHHMRLVLTRDAAEQTVLMLIKQAGTETHVLQSVPVDSDDLRLCVVARGQSHAFYFAPPGHDWQSIQHDVDARFLSIPVAGGFTGVYIGLYASSQGHDSVNHADFDDFVYQDLSS